jgi:hypothetical protein
MSHAAQGGSISVKTIDVYREVIEDIGDEPEQFCPIGAL